MKLFLIILIHVFILGSCRSDPASEIIREQVDIIDTTNIAPLSDTLGPSGIGNDSNKADTSEQ